MHKKMAQEWCKLFEYEFTGYSIDSVFFTGILEDGTVSNGSILWTGVINQLNDYGLFYCLTIPTEEFVIEK